MAGTIPVADRDRLDLGRLTGWMEASVQGFRGPLTYEKFAGGQSNPTYKLSSPSGSYVLRRKPFGKLLPSAHAVDREYRVIAGLSPDRLSRRAALWSCAPRMTCIIGTACSTSWGSRDGRNLRDGTLPDYAPAERTAIYHAMGDTLAALHNTDSRSRRGLGELRQAGQLLRAAGRALDAAVSDVRDRGDARGRAADRVACRRTVP